MLTCCGHPHLHCLVKTGRSQILPIWRPGERADGIEMLMVCQERGTHRKGTVRERGRHSGSMSMVRDRRRLRYSTSTNSKKAHKYDNTTEHQEQHIESFRLSRH